MSVELLVLSHHLHSTSYAADAFCREMLEGNLAQETVEINSIIRRGVTVGGQSVIGAAGIIAGTLACILAKKHAACIHNLVGKTLSFASRNT